MKNLPIIVGAVLIVIGVLFVLVTSGKGQSAGSTNNTATASADQKRGDKNVSSKTYSSAPAVLAEGDRIGKKALFQTSLGNFTVTLFGDKAPKTVSNFITLAKDGFYDNLTFHRIIANFMIQGGDPQGTGQGGPGYQFADEFDPSLTFAPTGILAMANSGPNTNGSQFFITVAPYTGGNNHYSIFGQVTDGMNVVVAISKVKADSSDKPVEPAVIKKIEIL